MTAQSIPRLRVCYPFAELVFKPVGHSQDTVEVYPRAQKTYDVVHYKVGLQPEQYTVIFNQINCEIQKGRFSPIPISAAVTTKFEWERSLPSQAASMPPQVITSLTVLNRTSLVGIALSIVFGGFQLITKQKVLTGRVATICNGIAITALVAAAFGQYIYRTQIKRIAHEVGLQIFDLIQKAETAASG